MHNKTGAVLFWQPYVLLHPEQVDVNSNARTKSMFLVLLSTLANTN